MWGVAGSLLETWSHYYWTRRLSTQENRWVLEDWETKPGKNAYVERVPATTLHLRQRSSYKKKLKLEKILLASQQTSHVGDVYSWNTSLAFMNPVPNKASIYLSIYPHLSSKQSGANVTTVAQPLLHPPYDLGTRIPAIFRLFSALCWVEEGKTDRSAFLNFITKIMYCIA